jgi:hypothetical protein
MVKRVPKVSEIADQVRNDGKGVRVVLRNRERQHPTGLDALATADMAS